MNLYVLAYNGYLMSASDLAAMQSTDPLFGESLTSPFYFI